MRVVFLDRDGVINEYPGDFRYITTPGEFVFLPDIKPALQKLNSHGFKIFIISNQAGVSKGLYTNEMLNLITRKMLEELSADKIDISGVYYCTHLPEEDCACRKPKTGLIEKAIAQLRTDNIDVEIKSSYFIGDSIKDIETGKSAGLKTILVFSGKEKPARKGSWEVLPDFTAKGLSEAVDLILQNNI